jgi:glycerophosphoinositol glycerophosphodiesterase
MTSDGKLVILDKQTLEKANIHKQISKISFEEIQDVDISEQHPLGKQFGEQKIMTLEALMKVMETLNVVVVLHASRTSSVFVEKLKEAIVASEPMFTKKIILCCRSPIIVYKVC